MTVGLPVFNGERYLREAIDSLLAQDYEDFEVLIGDNGSTDTTPKICEEYRRRDPRVSYFRSETNRGAMWNYNRLVGLASGRYFKWAAHDDLCAASFLRRCAEELDHAPDNVILCYPRTILIGEDGELLDENFWDGLDYREPSPHQRLRRYAAHPGEQHAVFGVIRTDALRRTRLIRPCWGGDVALLAELLLLGQFREIPDRLFYRRYHPGTSLAASRSPEAFEAWFDPDRGQRRALPRVRLLWEMADIIARSPIPAVERVRCLSAIADWMLLYWRVMGGEVKHALRHTAVRLTRPPPSEETPL